MSEQIGWQPLDEAEHDLWWCEAEVCDSKEEPDATWAFVPYEDTRVGDPSYLCAACYLKLLESKR